MESDYLKFFQSFVASMVEIGGFNLPRAVSIKLGRNLGEIYKNRGVTDQKTAVSQMFKAMGSKETSFEDTDDGYIVTTEFPSDFCSIGGGFKPKRHEMFFESICSPYAQGFLSTFNPGKFIKITCQECILKNPGNKCCIRAEIRK